MSSERRDVMDLGTRLSTLWVVVMFNMVFADILTFIKPGALQELWAGQAGVTVTPGLLLVFAILIEIPIAMIFLSRVLKPRTQPLGELRRSGRHRRVRRGRRVADSPLRVLRDR